MPTRNIRPLHVLWQQSLGVGMLDGVSSGIQLVLSLAGVSKKIKLEYLGQRRQPNWLDQNGLLNPYQSLDWHIKLARQKSKRLGCLNSQALLDSLSDNPTYKTEPRYELVVVNEPLHWSNNFLRSVGGTAREGQGANITLHGHMPLLQPVIGETDEDRKKRQFDYLLGTQMLTMHELGHVFGLFSRISIKDSTDQEIKKTHCLNECVMYGLDDAVLEKKIVNQPFCPSCLKKLKQFFIEP